MADVKSALDPPPSWIGCSFQMAWDIMTFGMDYNVRLIEIFPDITYQII